MDESLQRRHVCRLSGGNRRQLERQRLPIGIEHAVEQKPPRAGFAA